MKTVLNIFFAFFICNISFAQSCDYRYSSSIKLSPKDRIISSEQNAQLQIDINSYQNCIGITTDSAKLYWLNNAIAFDMNELQMAQDSVVKYGLNAFGYDKENLCQDYVRVYVYHELDVDFPMKRHYLDQVNDAEIDEVKSYCLNNYKEAELEIYAEVERNNVKTKSSIKFNQAYLDELEDIADNDQKERKERTINWDIQNQLDSLNRVRLDELYEKFGFPTNELVTEEGTMNAFMVLHHSRDCKWNEKWTRLFLKHKDEIDLVNVFSFYLYRNFNSHDGTCLTNVDFINELKNDASIEELMNFEEWDNKLKKR